MLQLQLGMSWEGGERGRAEHGAGEVVAVVVVVVKTWFCLTFVAAQGI
jgi:hypothetical protein